MLKNALNNAGPGGPPGIERYRIRQNLISLGDDYWIESGRGQKMFKVNGKVMNIRNTLDIEDRQGRCLVRIQAKLVSIRQAMDIEDGAGRKIATVKKGLVNLLRDTWQVDSTTPGQDMKVTGNLLDHEYEITCQGRKVAEVSKRFLSLRDCYGIEILPNQNDALILATVICVDQMAHPDNQAADGGLVHGTTANLGVLTPGQGGGPISVNNANVALGGVAQAVIAPPGPMGAPGVAPVVAGMAVAGAMAPQPMYGAPPGQPMYGAPPGQPMYGAPPGQPMYGVPPGQPMYGAPPGQPMYGAPAPGVPVGAIVGAAAVAGAMSQPQYGAPPGQPMYAAPGQPQYAPQQQHQQPGLVNTLAKGAVVNAIIPGNQGVASALVAGSLLNARK